MSLQFDSKEALVSSYTGLCKDSDDRADVACLWTPTCARLRDLAAYQQAPFTYTMNQTQQLNIGNATFSWVDEVVAKNLVTKLGMLDLGIEPISLCRKRVHFIEEGIERFGNVLSNELNFIANFTSGIIWLKPSRDDANFGNSSFYKAPHLTFVSDGTFFFIPPFKQVPREFGVLGLVENLYHESLHHQVHAHCAFTQTHYCVDRIDAFTELLALPDRPDRTFTLFQAINAYHVYRQITPFRLRLLDSLIQQGYSKKSLDWLKDAAQTSFVMWHAFARALFLVRDKFVDPWPSLIETWQDEANALHTETL